MKLSVETGELRRNTDDFKAIEMIKEAGFDELDFSYFAIPYEDDGLNENYIEYAYKIKEHLHKTGIECCQAHAPFTFKYGQKMDRSEPWYEVVVRSIEGSAIIGTKAIIVHAVDVPEGVDFAQYNYEYYKSLEPYAKEFGIKIAVENLFFHDEKRKHLRGNGLGSANEFNEFLDKLNSPWFVGCIDLGHAGITGQEPETFIKGVKKEYLKHLHVHDNFYINDEHLMPYIGRFNWDKIMNALKEAEYDGEFSMEIGGFFRNIPEELKLDALKFAEKIGRHLIEKV